MAGYDWMSGMIAALNDSNSGGGAGQFPTSATEQIKAALNVDSANKKLIGSTAVPAASAPMGAVPEDLVPTPAPGPSRWDSFTTALNTPTGAAGLATMLGGLAKAVLPQKSNSEFANAAWRFGDFAEKGGQNIIAANQYNNLMSKLVPPATPAPGAPADPNSAGEAQRNFQTALLLRPLTFSK